MARSPDPLPGRRHRPAHRRTHLRPRPLPDLRPRPHRRLPLPGHPHRQPIPGAGRRHPGRSRHPHPRRRLDPPGRVERGSPRRNQKQHPPGRTVTSDRSITKRCTCKDPTTGRRLNTACPKLRRPGGSWSPVHGVWGYQLELPIAPRTNERQFARCRFRWATRSQLHLPGGPAAIFHTVVAQAQEAESSGFDTVLLMDHFYQPSDLFTVAAVRVRPARPGPVQFRCRLPIGEG